MIKQRPKPRCLICGSVCDWVGDMWVCTDPGCESEWSPEHGPQFEVDDNGDDDQDG